MNILFLLKACKKLVLSIFALTVLKSFAAGLLKNCFACSYKITFSKNTVRYSLQIHKAVILMYLEP
jgi:hypothetical protein